MKKQKINPGEMETMKIKADILEKLGDEIMVRVAEVRN